MFQTSNVVMAEPPAMSLPKETSSSHTVPLQVEDFCVTCGIITSILFQTPVATPAPRPSAVLRKGQPPSSMIPLQDPEIVKERKKGPKAPSPQVSGSTPETVTLSSDDDLPWGPKGGMANVDQVRHMRNFLDSDSPGFFVSPTLVSRAGRGSRGFVWPSFSYTSR